MIGQQKTGEKGSARVMSNKFFAKMDKQNRSAKERRRAWELRMLQRAGKIVDLQEQVRFTLIDAQYDKNHKLIERKAEYVADFTYWENGKFIVEDVKGYKNSTAYALYVLKRKLMLERYGYRIRET